MPWTVKDVDKFKKGLSDEQKKKWVAIANKALRECLKQEGADDLDCEAKAIKQANGSFSDTRPDLSQFSNPLRPDDHSRPMHLALAEIAENEKDEEEEDDEEEAQYQLAFPIGAFNTGKYGEVIVTRTFAERMEKHWREGVLGKRSVYMDTEHDFAEANAWAADMRVTDNGLEIKWDFNERGKELISDKRYRFYSASIGYAIDIETGEERFPVLHAVSLTNRPVMYTMPEAHLSEAGNNPAHGDRSNISLGGNMETLKEILEALFALPKKELEELTDEQRTQVVDLFDLEVVEGNDNDNETAREFTKMKQDIENRDERIRVLLDENKTMSAQLGTLRKEKHDARKAEVIEAALTDGKILPKNRTKWEAMYDKDPEGVEGLLGEKGSEVDTGTRGNGSGGDEGGEFDENAFAYFKRMNPELTDDEARAEYKKYGGAE
jgi:phage I-like protein